MKVWMLWVRESPNDRAEFVGLYRHAVLADASTSHYKGLGYTVELIEREVIG